MTATGLTLPTVGFFARRMDLNDFDWELWKEAHALASQGTANLLLLGGHTSFQPDPLDVVSSAVYRLVNARLLDGAIVSQTISLWMDETEVARFAQELPDLPLITTSIPYPGHPCLAIDNAPGLRALIRHLVHDHGCQRIVHIRGPQGNGESQVREAVWRQELARAGIQPLDSWLVQGHFVPAGLEGIGQNLLAQTHGEFDAVVACNDTAAFHVIRDLAALGHRVPEDYLVCGFDDVSDSQFSRPSLTTVRQPYREQMHRSWTGILNLLATGKEPENQVLGTSLVIRGSCSCPPSAWSAGGFPFLEKVLGSTPATWAAPNTAASTQALMTMATHHHDELARRQAKESALSDFDRAMNQVTDHEQLILALRESLPRMGIHRFAVLATCGEQGTLREHVCVREPGKVLPQPPEFFRVLTTQPATESSLGNVLPWESLSLPGWFGAIEPFIQGVFPLIHGELWYGLAFFELTPDQGTVERNVQEQLAAVFHRLAFEKALFEKNLEQRTRALLQTEKMGALSRIVSEVAHELNTPLGAIVSSHSHLESGLGAMVHASGEFFLGLEAPTLQVFRELAPLLSRPRSPGLRAVDRERRKAWTSLLAAFPLEHPAAVADALLALGWEEEADLPRLAAVPGLEKVVGYLGRWDDLVTSAQVISLASEKVSTFVSRLKNTTRRMTSEEVTPVDLRESLDTALLLVQKEIDRGVTLVWKPPQHVPSALCRAAEVQQVWINLLQNAFHAVAYRGQVTLTLADEAPWVRVSVADNGYGIPEHLGTQIFTPFFTTKPEGEGLGLGLDIARQIVEGVGGIIGFESGQAGTVFHVRLPASDRA